MILFSHNILILQDWWQWREKIIHSIV